MSDPTPIPVQFGTQLAEHVSGPLTQELAENVYLEHAPKGSEFQYTLLGTPGLKPFCQPTTGEVRGMHVLAGYIFAVIGQTLYRVSESAAYETIGTILGTGAVRMAENGDHLWIATSSKLYAANASGIWELPESNMVGVVDQDGFLIGAQRGQFFWISGLRDVDPDAALSIDGSDFSSADKFSDENIGMVRSGPGFAILKERSTEFYANTGAAAFPFTRVETNNCGCIAGDSIAQAPLGEVFWLGADRQVYQLAGYQAVPISTPSVVRLIQEQSSPQTSRGFCRQQDGHTFYTLTVGTGLTIEYDLTTGLWHKLKSDGIDRWRGNCHAYAWRKHLVGDYASGDIFELDPETYDEDGGVLRRRMVGAPVYNNGLRQVIDEFRLNIETGVGLATGQGSDPQAILDASSDGGATYGSELWRSIGAMGARKTQVVWRRLGAHVRWTPRITISDPVPVRVNGAYVRRTELAA